MEIDKYTIPYYLADGIYPTWAMFQKAISQPSTQKHRAFSSQQEAVQKDVERPYGVLVSRWHVLKNPIRLHRRTDIANIVLACIILHNMVVEMRRDSYASEMYSLAESLEGGPSLTASNLTGIATYHARTTVPWRDRGRMQSRSDRSQWRTTRHTIYSKTT
jgi:Plant transposon protein/Caulimovirus viroplasmin